MLYDANIGIDPNVTTISPPMLQLSVPQCYNYQSSNVTTISPNVTTISPPMLQLSVQTDDVLMIVMPNIGIPDGNIGDTDRCII